MKKWPKSKRARETRRTREGSASRCATSETCACADVLPALFRDYLQSRFLRFVKTLIRNWVSTSFAKANRIFARLQVQEEMTSTHWLDTTGDVSFAIMNTTCWYMLRTKTKISSSLRTVLCHGKAVNRTVSLENWIILVIFPCILWTRVYQHTSYGKRN